MCGVRPVLCAFPYLCTFVQIWCGTKSGKIHIFDAVSYVEDAVSVHLFMPALFSAQVVVCWTHGPLPSGAAHPWHVVWATSFVHNLTSDTPKCVVIATHLDYLDKTTLTRVLQALDAHTDRVRTMISAGDVVISGSASKDGTAAIWEADRIWVD